MYINVHVFPGSKREKFVERGNLYELHVKEKAERNLANTRVREMLAEHFDTVLGKVRLLHGHHCPRKLFSIDKDISHSSKSI